MPCPAFFAAWGGAEEKNQRRKGNKTMDLLRGNIKHTYFKYLGAAFGSAMLASVYSLVDMAMVGQ